MFKDKYCLGQFAKESAITTVRILTYPSWHSTPQGSLNKFMEHIRTDDNLLRSNRQTHVKKLITVKRWNELT